MIGGGVWSCAHVKLFLTAVLFICSLATITDFLLSRPAVPYTSDLGSSLSSVLSSPQSPPTLNPTSPSLHPLKHQEQVLDDGVVRRALNPVGSAAYLFIQMGAYRGGVNTFAAVGLASKPLHVFAKPRFVCEWTPHDEGGGDPITAPGHTILPDWGYGRVYTVVVVNCTFPAAVGADGSGGRLVLYASAGGGKDRASETEEERIDSLVEAPGSVNASAFAAPPRYDCLYCGSPLYGDLSPQRVREWVAYHARLFGERSHLVIHDAGGVHSEVMEVLRPWMEKGVVTLQDVREEERFDGYYHNQFLVLNDCLHRYRLAAKWIFFFDVDEFVFVDPKTTLSSLLDSLSHYTQFTIDQVHMSSGLCLSGDASGTAGMWGFEKLVYRDVKKGVRRDRKYAIQPRSAFAAGVHISQNVAGRTLYRDPEGRIKYFHYHGTIADRRDPCRELVDAARVSVNGTPFVRDDTLRGLAGSVKGFEVRSIGSRLQRTRQ